MQKTIGGDRLGSGKKMQVDLKTYNRSTHDLGYLWRSTMASGTLVPFMKEVMLPGDTFDIELEGDCLTHPTIGPLFGSYKMQLDVFFAPLRLYNSALHNNKAGIGMEMEKVKLPKLQLDRVRSTELNTTSDPDNFQVNPSSLLSYLDIRGAGTKTEAGPRYKKFNAVPLLAYWDIYKNYYANQQEEKGAVVDINPTLPPPTSMQLNGLTITASSTVATTLDVDSEVNIFYNLTSGYFDGLEETLELDRGGVGTNWADVRELFINKQKEFTPGLGWTIRYSNVWPAYLADTVSRYRVQDGTSVNPERKPTVNLFPLENLDLMKESILAAGPFQEFIISPTDTNQHPYNACLRITGTNLWATATSRLTQQGLAIKTYQNDLFNNWMNSEWLDNQTTGINAITAIDTSDGSFNIDTLNLANKVYNMLNRIAISGGTYRDWIEVTYTHDFINNSTAPVYQGGLSKELVFEEVISNAETEDQPLGTLAGRGRLNQKNKGGKLVVKANEHGYLIGIVSLTPRVDYSQGNKWDVNLDNMNDFHKPALDQIGFQDLLQEQQAWWANVQTGAGEDTITKYATGKQPAWINYMTNVNQVKGNFAIPNNQMFMTLNRRYEKPVNFTSPTIRDNTTYIDPAKFNFIFADTSASAQNFWVQIGIDIKARRKMSAKIMPNL